MFFVGIALSASIQGSQSLRGIEFQVSDWQEASLFGRYLDSRGVKSLVVGRGREISVQLSGLSASRIGHVIESYKTELGVDLGKTAKREHLKLDFPLITYRFKRPTSFSDLLQTIDDRSQLSRALTYVDQNLWPPDRPQNFVELRYHLRPWMTYKGKRCEEVDGTLVVDSAQTETVSFRYAEGDSMNDCRISRKVGTVVVDDAPKLEKVDACRLTPEEWEQSVYFKLHPLEPVASALSEHFDLLDKLAERLRKMHVMSCIFESRGAGGLSVEKRAFRMALKLAHEVLGQEASKGLVKLSS